MTLLGSRRWLELGEGLSRSSSDFVIMFRRRGYRSSRLAEEARFRLAEEARDAGLYPEKASSALGQLAEGFLKL